MSDNTQISLETTGDIIATDDVGGVKYQRMKVTMGDDGVSDGDVSSSNPLPVTLTGVLSIKGDKGDTGGIQPSGYGSATIDFGSTLTNEGSLVITGLTDMLTTSHVMVFIEGDDTTVDNDADAHKNLAAFSTCYVTARVAGVGFTANVVTQGYVSNTFKIHYIFVK